MNCKLLVETPSLSPIRFVEYKRSFMVRGKIICDGILPNNCLLEISLLDSNNKVVRKIKTNKKNGPIYLNYPCLVTYEEKLDPKKEKLKEYGFSLLCVDDLNNPEATLPLASRKAWYSDNYFEGIIVSASNKASGALFDDDLCLVNDDLKPYSLLEMGEYELVVSLKGEGISCEIKETITIGKRNNQIICRFHPDSHHDRMINWVKENGFTIIKDTMPGYLEPYLGVWYYHMGLIKTYHANDLVLYENQKIHAFIYLMDTTSTSYKAELPYVQKQHLMEKGLFHAYYYDIGEAIVQNRKASIKEFKDDEYMHICRIDIVNVLAKDNIYYLDERHLKESIFDLNNIYLHTNEDICVMGIVKPYQQDDEDFVLNEANNTYDILNYPKTIRYLFKVDNEYEFVDKSLMMERFEDISIGNSAYEFYNLIHIAEKWKNKKVLVEIQCFDAHERMTNAHQSFIINVM